MEDAREGRCYPETVRRDYCAGDQSTHIRAYGSLPCLLSLSRFLWTSLWLALFLFSPISLRIWTESEGGGVSQPASHPPPPQKWWDKEAMRDLGCECKASTHWPNDLGEAQSEHFNTLQQGTITNTNTTEPTEGGRIWKTNDLSQIKPRSPRSDVLPRWKRKWETLKGSVIKGGRKAESFSEICPCSYYRGDSFTKALTQTTKKQIFTS